MNIKKIKSVYFSPNGGSEKIIRTVVNALGKYEVEEYNQTMKKDRTGEIEVLKDEILVICFPVYADRIPSVADDIINRIKGKNGLAVVLVSYGNRDYGDALLELKNKINARGFKVIGAAAAIAEHCLNTNIATSRPDDIDKEKLDAFASQINFKISTIHNYAYLKEVNVKGNYPYSPYKSQRTPVGDDKCIQCGLCFKNCPTGAIDKDDYRKTDKDLCIFCGRCIQVCPTNARDIKDKDFLQFMNELEKRCEARKEIKAFI